MTQSVKLGIWENTLDDYADSLANVTEVLERGAPIKMTRAEVIFSSKRLYGRAMSLLSYVSLIFLDFKKSRRSFRSQTSYKFGF